MARTVATQIGGAVAQMSGDRVEIRLDPPELGRVSLSFSFAQDSVTAVLAADRQDTADLIRRHEDALQKELAAAGFENVDLAFGDASGEKDAEDGESAANAGDESPPATPRAAPRSAPAGKLDIRI